MLSSSIEIEKDVNVGPQEPQPKRVCLQPCIKRRNSASSSEDSDVEYEELEPTTEVPPEEKLPKRRLFKNCVPLQLEKPCIEGRNSASSSEDSDVEYEELEPTTEVPPEEKLPKRRLFKNCVPLQLEKPCIEGRNSASSSEDSDVEYEESDYSSSSEEDFVPIQRNLGGKGVSILGIAASTKKDICIFCKKEIRTAAFARHLQQMHFAEKEVAEMANLSDTITKKRAIQIIRNKGNYVNNLMVLKDGGHLVLVQRPKKTIHLSSCKDLSAYVSCNKCLGFYSRNDVYRHRCPADPYAADCKVRPIAFFTHTQEASSQMKAFEEKMRKDNIGDIILKDAVLRSFIEDEITAKGMEKYSSIANKARALAVFLLSARKHYNDHNITFVKLLRTCNLDTIKSIIIKDFEYRCETTEAITMDRPASLKKLCQSLIQLTSYIERQYLKKSEFERAKEAKVLLKLYDSDLRPMMTNATHMMKKPASGNPQALPEKQNIAQFKAYLIKQMHSLKNEGSNLRRIKETLLAYIILFNKRRPAEVSRLTTEDWEKRGSWKTQTKGDQQRLSEEEKKLLSETEIVYVKGKCRRLVPIIFPKICVEKIEWINNFQQQKYIFSNERGNPI